MRKTALTLILACVAPLVAGPACAAGSFRTQVQKANTMLESGNPTGARDKYRELMTEDPESPVLQYNLGLADCSEAAQFKELGSTRDALQALDQAKQAFEKVAKTAKDPALRDDAAFNRANATTRQAKLAAEAAEAGRGLVMPGTNPAQAASGAGAADAGDEITPPQQLYKIAVQSFEDAVAQYEDLLDRRPDHAGAKQNLDHVRYLLKSMLQNPPPPPEQQQDGQDEQQDQEKKDQEQDQQQQQEQQQAKQQEQQQEQQQENQQDQQDQTQAAEDLPEKNVEALLQSLEEIDERERQEMKNRDNRGNPVQGKWW